MPRRSEVQNMTRAELSQAYLNHIDITGAEPPHNHDPTVEQIAAMKVRVMLRAKPHTQTSAAQDEAIDLAAGLDISCFGHSGATQLRRM